MLQRRHGLRTKCLHASHRRPTARRSGRSGGARAGRDRAVDHRARRTRRAPAVSRRGILVPVHVLHAAAASVGARGVWPHRSGTRRATFPTDPRSPGRRFPDADDGVSSRATPDAGESRVSACGGQAPEQAGRRAAGRGAQAVTARAERGAQAVATGAPCRSGDDSCGGRSCARDNTRACRRADAVRRGCAQPSRRRRAARARAVQGAVHDREGHARQAASRPGSHAPQRADRRPGHHLRSRADAAALGSGEEEARRDGSSTPRDAVVLAIASCARGRQTSGVGARCGPMRVGRQRRPLHRARLSGISPCHRIHRRRPDHGGQPAAPLPRTQRVRGGRPVRGSGFTVREHSPDYGLGPDRAGP